MKLLWTSIKRPHSQKHMQARQTPAWTMLHKKQKKLSDLRYVAVTRATWDLFIAYCIVS